MPLLDGHHGQRLDHLVKEFLKLYYPYLVHDHQLLFNSKGLDVDGTPPDDLVDYIHRLRLRQPEVMNSEPFRLVSSSGRPVRLTCRMPNS